VEHHRCPPAVPRPLSSSCRVRCPGELRLLTSNSRHPLVCPHPLYFPRFVLTGLLAMQPCLPHRQPGPSLCPCRRSNAPEPSLEVTNLPMPLIPHFLPCCSRNRSPELSCAAVGPLRHERCRAHGRVCRVTSNSPEPFPSAPHLCRGRALASVESPPRNRAVSPLVALQPSPSSPSDLRRSSEI
jgi:hypothetical protein